MNSTLSKQVAAVAVVLGLGLALSSSSAQAENRCAKPTVGGEARACAASREGTVALRRFVERTQAIYGLSYWDFQPAEPAPVAAASGAPSVAMMDEQSQRIASTSTVR